MTHHPHTQVASLATTPLSDRQAVLLGDIIPTGLFAAEQGGVGPATGHDIVLVVGCGPVGLMGVCAALHKGASIVLATDMVRCHVLWKTIHDANWQ